MIIQKEEAREKTIEKTKVGIKTKETKEGN